MSYPLQYNQSYFLDPFRPKTFMGELRLQSCEEANIFYSAHIKKSEDLGAGDYSQACQLMPKSFTHEYKSEMEEVIVNGDSTIIQGVFKDRIGELNNMDVEYAVNVYLWVEVEV